MLNGAKSPFLLQFNFMFNMIHESERVHGEKMYIFTTPPVNQSTDS